MKAKFVLYVYVRGPGQFLPGGPIWDSYATLVTHMPSANLERMGERQRERRRSLK